MLVLAMIRMAEARVMAAKVVADGPHGEGQGPVGVQYFQSSGTKDGSMEGAEEELMPEGKRSWYMSTTDALLIFT